MQMSSSLEVSPGLIATYAVDIHSRLFEDGLPVRRTQARDVDFGPLVRRQIPLVSRVYLHCVIPILPVQALGTDVGREPSASRARQGPSRRVAKAAAPGPLPGPPPGPPPRARRQSEIF